jgi:hypothetical protein
MRHAKGNNRWFNGGPSLNHEWRFGFACPVEGGAVGAEPNALQGFTRSSTTGCPEGARSFVVTVEASALAEGARTENMRTRTITSEPKSLAREHKVVSREEWIAARVELLKKEKELTHFPDQLTSERKELMSMKNCTQPWKGNDGQRIIRDLEELSTKFGERNDCGNDKEFVSQRSVYTHNFTLRISRLFFRNEVPEPQPPTVAVRLVLSGAESPHAI